MIQSTLVIKMTTNFEALASKGTAVWPSGLGKDFIGLVRFNDLRSRPRYLPTSIAGLKGESNPMSHGVPSSSVHSEHCTYSYFWRERSHRADDRHARGGDRGGAIDLIALGLAKGSAGLAVCLERCGAFAIRSTPRSEDSIPFVAHRSVERLRGRGERWKPAVGWIVSR